MAVFFHPYPSFSLCVAFHLAIELVMAIWEPVIPPLPRWSQFLACFQCFEHEFFSSVVEITMSVLKLLFCSRIRKHFLRENKAFVAVNLTTIPVAFPKRVPCFPIENPDTKYFYSCRSLVLIPIEIFIWDHCGNSPFYAVQMPVKISELWNSPVHSFFIRIVIWPCSDNI